MNARLQANLLRLGHVDYGSAPAHKLISDNRELYIEQSRRTVTGKAADLPKPPSSAIDLPANAGGGANR